MQPAPIEPRTRAEFEAQLAELATSYSGWRPAADGRPDPGSALIGVAARFAEIVAERVNRIPERGFLTFLNLIGTTPLPPQAARVPLTFTLADRLPADVLVPAGTQVAAEPVADTADGDGPGGDADGPGADGDTVVFETETPLVVTRSRLVAVHVSDPRLDTVTTVDPATTAGPFEAFTGAGPAPHELYLRVGPEPFPPPLPPFRVLLDDRAHAGTAALLTAPGAVSWTCWDGSIWQPLQQPDGAPAAARRDPLTGEVVLDVPALPWAAPREVNGITGLWLRARLEILLPAADLGPVDPTTASTGSPGPHRRRDPDAKLLTGDGSTYWFRREETRLSRAAGLGRLGVAGEDGVTLTFFCLTDTGWQRLGTTDSAGVVTSDPGVEFGDTTAAFTRADGEVSLTTLPSTLLPVVVDGRPGYQLWIRVTRGGYTTYPVWFSQEVGGRLPSPLPTLRSVTLLPDGAAGTDEPVRTGLGDGRPLDLSADFRPFGERPAWGDTLHLAAPAGAVGSAERLTLAITLTNAAGKPAGVPTVTATPVLRWETFDGSVWQQATASRPDAFTTDGDVVLTPAAPLVASPVAGVTAPWVRVRMVSGDYGQAATYHRTEKGTYEPVPATYAPPVVTSLAWRRAEATRGQVPSAAVTRNVDSEVTRWATAVEAGRTPPFQPFVPVDRSDPALYLGFDRPFGPGQVTLFASVAAPAPADVTAGRLDRTDPGLPPDVRWEYSAGGGWRPLSIIDATGTFEQSGTLRFAGPPDQAATACFGRRAWWVRARWARGEFRVPPRLHGMLPNTTWASASTTITREVLGSGNGEPGQAFTTAQRPVLPGQSLVVREPVPPPDPEADALRALEGDDAVMIVADDAGRPGEVWVRWHAVADLFSSGPADRHYTIDPLTGRLGFGDGRTGRLLPRGAGNVRITYRTGGGPGGNLPAGSITRLRTAIPGLDGVTNVEAAAGGAGREPLARVVERGPRALRHRNRAVTSADLEDLAREASPDVALARAITPSGYDPLSLRLDRLTEQEQAKLRTAGAGRVGVIVVPRSAGARPTPSLALLRQVRAYLLERAPATADVWTAGPEWVRVTVTATVVPRPDALADAVRSAVLAALDRYLHPLSGGPDGTGWPFGRLPAPSALVALVQRVPGVDHVRRVLVDRTPESANLGERLAALVNRTLAEQRADPPPHDLRRWLDRALVCSGRHHIDLTLGG